MNYHWAGCQAHICPDVHVSRFGVILKTHQPGKWRLITDLSHPQGHSINDGIPYVVYPM